MALKTSYKSATGQEWTPKLAESLEQKTTVSKERSPKESASSGDQILLEIKEVGDKIRQLKQGKAEKVSDFWFGYPCHAMVFLAVRINASQKAVKVLS